MGVVILGVGLEGVDSIGAMNPGSRVSLAHNAKNVRFRRDDIPRHLLVRLVHVRRLSSLLCDEDDFPLLPVRMDRY